MKTKYRCLDLFSGTGSIANAFRRAGFDVVTVDNNANFNADYIVDIFKLDYKSLGYFDVVWASPPCTCFSVASISTHWMRKGNIYTSKTDDADIAIKIIELTKDIISYIEPAYWFIENPRGMLRKMPIMNGLPRNTITYCQYGDTRMKPTDIWGIFPKDFPIMACKNGDTCHERAPRGSNRGTQGLKNKIDRARIPKGFCDLLANMIKDELNKR